MVLQNFLNSNLGPTNIIKNWNFILNNMLVDGLERTTIPGYDDFFSSRFYEGNENLIDASASDCSYTNFSSSLSKRGAAWFATQYDQFDDSSVSAVNWSETLSPSGTGSSTITESGIKVRMIGTPGDNGSATTILLSNGSTGLDMRGQDGEVVAFVNWSNSDPSSSGSGAANSDLKIIVGSSSTPVYTISSIVGTEGSSESGTNDFRLVFNNSAQTVDVWRDGTKVASAIDISGEANWYVGFYIQSDSSSANDAFSNFIDIYTVGYVKDGDSNTVNFESDNTTASATVGTMFGRFVTDGGSSTLAGSVNGGTTFTTLTNKAIATIGPTGTEVRIKVSQTVPSINNTTTNIKKLTEYGVFYG